MIRDGFDSWRDRILCEVEALVFVVAFKLLRRKRRAA